MQIINLCRKNRKSLSRACSEASLFLNANTLNFHKCIILLDKCVKVNISLEQRKAHAISFEP